MSVPIAKDEQSLIEDYAKQAIHLICVEIPYYEVEPRGQDPKYVCLAICQKDNRDALPSTYAQTAEETVREMDGVVKIRWKDLLNAASAK